MCFANCAMCTTSKGCHTAPVHHAAPESPRVVADVRLADQRHLLPHLRVQERPRHLWCRWKNVCWHARMVPVM